eukprot:6490797-Amphidinium_carterae.1
MQDGRKWYALDVLGGASIAVGKPAAEKQQPKAQARAPQTPMSLAPQLTLQSHPVSHTEALLGDSMEREDSFFTHSVELETDACSTAWTVLEQPHVYSTSSPETQNHSNAKLAMTETLLPDTGAVDNLIGLNTARRFAASARKQGSEVKWSRLQKPRLISGVGGRPAVAYHQVSIQGRLPSGRSLIYTAPVIGDASADVPALLGLREMSAAGIVYVPKEARLWFIHDLKQVRWPQNSHYAELVESPSGHQLLPFITPPKSETGRLALKDVATYHNLTASPSAGSMRCSDAVPARVKHSVSFATFPADEETVQIADCKPMQQEQASALTVLEPSARRTEIMNAVEAMLLSKKVPLAPQRTNLFDPVTDRHRSMLIGLFTTRGQSVTRATRENEELVVLLHQLATTRPKDRRGMPYASIQLTVADEVGLPAHQDQRNGSRTDIIAFGHYEGGLLWVASASGKTPCPQRTLANQTVTDKGTSHDIYRRWCTFDGTRWHSTTPHKGHRISVAFYLP